MQAENSKQRVRIGAVQICSTDDLERNLGLCERLAERASQEGAELVVLPENFCFIGGLERKAAIAEDLELPDRQPILGQMIALARRLGVHLLLGGMPVKSADPARFYNTAVLISPEGGVQRSYRKLHLFDVNIPGGAVFHESSAVLRGREVVTVPFGPTVLGLSICYDLRFPELYRKLVERGAEVLLVPAAFTLHTGRDHWLPLLRARAIENQAYVVAAAQVGQHTSRRASYGRTCVVDPWGIVVAQLADGEGTLVVDLDLDYLRQLRRELPCLEHGRFTVSDVTP